MESLYSTFWPWSPWRSLTVDGQPRKWNKQTENELRLKATTWNKDYEKKLRGKLRILVYGHTGHGKTTFLNSLATALNNKPMYVGNAGAGGESMTLRVECHNLVKSYFNVVDMPGISGDLTDEMLDKVLDGNFTPGQMVTDLSGKAKSPSDQIFAIVLVVSAVKAVNVLYQKLLNVAKKKGILVYVVLTHIDLVDDVLKKKPTNIFWSDKVYSLVKRNSEVIWNIPESQILVILNYFEHVDDINKNILLLSALDNILRGAKYQAERLLDTPVANFEV